MRSSPVLTASITALIAISTAAPATAQTQGYEGFRREAGRAITTRRVEEPASTRSAQASATEFRFKNAKDSLEWSRAKKLADKSTGFRVIVSLQERHLWVVAEEDTLLSAPVAVATGNILTYAGREFKFETPRGKREVLSKDADPIWNPPDWLYVETAKEHGLKIAYIPKPPGTIATSTGIRLGVQNNRVVTIDDEGPSDFPADLHIIYGETLYIPPLGTDNRRVNGTLGKYKLALGDGYMLHGTPHQSSIGMAATHGCIRLRDEDIEWLYENVPVGAKVYIY